MPMPPPPPPGPPGPPPPAMPAFNPKKGGGGQDQRGALLQSIRSGAKLKKAVTIDKSAPFIPGKVSNNSSSNNDLGRTKFSSPSSNTNTSSQPVTNGLALGGLFAGGMPKLRQTGLRTGANPGLSVSSNGNGAGSGAHDRRPSPEPPTPRQGSVAQAASQLSDALRRGAATEVRRGPPPQPPINRGQSADSTTDSPRFKLSPESPIPNKSSLHRLPSSQPSTLPSPVGSAPSTPTPRLQTSHGKPHVAPKPPGSAPSAIPSKPATPPKKLIVNGRQPVSRAQSMRVPRSPPVQGGGAFPATTVNGKDFGTIRGIPSAFHSQENLSRPPPHHTRNQTLPVNLMKAAAPPPPVGLGRPSARPPVPPPPSRTAGVKAPLSPPPPPPGTAMPPPPPPHRQQAPPPPPPSHSRPPPAIPVNGPPPPPVRNSSMRSSMDLDSRFCNLFHPVTDFPAPPRFYGFTKQYSNKNAANKQQAPLPPSVNLGNKLWEASTC